MTFADFITALAVLGPIAFFGGLLAGHRFHHIGRVHHDHRR